jgi:diaminopimelate decarboxylase
MSDFVRPGLYGAFHQVIPLKEEKKEKIVADVVGPICESGDFLGKNVKITKPDLSSFIAVRDTGAYGFSMASNYNARLRPPEVIVDKTNFFVVRDRETYEDLIRKEKIIPE